MDIKNRKKAEITSETLVKTILIIIAFAILVLFIYFIYTQLGWSGMVDQEVCHQSVIYRGTLPGFGGTKEFVPLKCKTEKICITSGFIGGSCKEFEGSTGITKVKVKTRDEVEQFMARNILDCWTMMGEGKVSVFSQWLAQTYGIGGIYPSCVICSRIAFDQANLEKAGIDLKEVNIMKYMMTHAIHGKNISYYSYLSDERGLISVKNNMDLKEISFDKDGKLIEGDKVETQNLPQTIPGQNDSQELAVLFMQISSPKNVLKNSLTTIGVTWGTGALLSPVMSVKKLLSPWTYAVLAVVGVYQAYSVEQNKAVSASKCDDVSSSGSEAREGCSVVRTVNYNLEDIRNYCSYIESIP
jgi:hypothetical protein